jgi:hypothetical protein
MTPPQDSFQGRKKILSGCLSPGRGRERAFLKRLIIVRGALRGEKGAGSSANVVDLISPR